jgi:hypothetical protein
MENCLFPNNQDQTYPWLRVSIIAAGRGSYGRSAFSSKPSGTVWQAAQPLLMTFFNQPSVERVF